MSEQTNKLNVEEQRLDFALGFEIAVRQSTEKSTTEQCMCLLLDHERATKLKACELLNRAVDCLDENRFSGTWREMIIDVKKEASILLADEAQKLLGEPK